MHRRYEHTCMYYMYVCVFAVAYTHKGKTPTPLRWPSGCLVRRSMWSRSLWAPRKWWTSSTRCACPTTPLRPFYSRRWVWLVYQIHVHCTTLNNVLYDNYCVPKQPLHNYNYNICTCIYMYVRCSCYCIVMSRKTLVCTCMYMYIHVCVLLRVTTFMNMLFHDTQSSM